MNKKTTLTLVAAVAVSALALAGGLQKHPTHQTLKESKSKGAPPAHLSDVNAVTNPKAIRPVKKGGAKPKGQAAYSTFHADNESGYVIDVFIDGSFAGRLAPYGDGYNTIFAGGHTFFAQTPDGAHTWGPSGFFGPVGGTFTESLY